MSNYYYYDFFVNNKQSYISTILGKGFDETERKKKPEKQKHGTGKGIGETEREKQKNQTNEGNRKQAWESYGKTALTTALILMDIIIGIKRISINIDLI